MKLHLDENFYFYVLIIALRSIKIHAFHGGGHHLAAVETM
jgi:hypothetical protein